jgi:hypothetical protein
LIESKLAGESEPALLIGSKLARESESQLVSKCGPPPEEVAVRAMSQRIVETTGDVRLEAVLDPGFVFSDFESVLHRKSSSLRALLGVAIAQLRLRKLMEACDSFVGVLEMEPENVEALSGFQTLLSAVKGVRLQQERWDVTRLRMAQFKYTKSPALRSFFGLAEGECRLEGNLADPEFREVLRVLLDDGLLV